MTIFSLLSRRRFRFFQGFTQIEILVIVFIIGLMAAIATPSFAGMLESANMKQTIVDIRIALQETQRQSIRTNQACQAEILIPAEPSQGAMVEGNCLTTGDRKLPHGIGLATNILSIPAPSISDASPSSTFDPSLTVHRASLGDKICISPLSCQNTDPPSTTSNSRSAFKAVDKKADVGFSPLGGAKFEIAMPSDNLKIEGQSAKFIGYSPNQLDGKKTCIVVSRSLGLTRLGVYEGSLDPVEITTSGKCQVARWTEP